MEKKKEDASCITPPTTNPSTTDISRPLYPGISNYMPSYYGPVPHAWLPPFMPPPSANPYPLSNQQQPWNSTTAAASSTAALTSSANLHSPAIPMMGPPLTAYPYLWSNQQQTWNSTIAPMSSSPTNVSSSVAASCSVQSSASVASSSCEALPAFVPPTNANPYPCGSEENQVKQSNSTEEISEASLESIDCEEQSTASLGNTVETKEAGSSGSLHIQQSDGGDIAEDPKPGMCFENENALMAYYKQYGKQEGFPVMTQRSKREKDGSIKYVTLGCARGGKARNKASNVSKPRPTSKTECKARMNVMFKNGKLCITSVFNTHNHVLSPRKARFFRCNREVNESVRRVLDTNDQAGIRMNKSFQAISHLALEKKFQNVYTNEKFREVQQEIMGMIYCHCRFEKMDGVIATYKVDDEVKAEDFIKEVTYTVLFNEAECEAKCLCGLFEMRGIICRHILAIFSARKVRELPDKFILDRWRKDIKRRYTIIPSSHDVADQRPETVRYKRLLKICYEVITNACTEDGHTEDMVSKLYAMNEVYCTSKPHNIDSNVGVSTVNAATEGSSKKVLSPHVVRGKGRPPCKRRMSTMEEQMRKKKTKAVRKKGDKGKSRLRRGLDNELLESSGNPLCGHMENAQTPVMVDQESVQEEVMGTQETIQLGMDGTQPKTADGTQPNSML